MTPEKLEIREQDNQFVRDMLADIERLRNEMFDQLAVLEHVHPLIKAAGVPPMAAKVGIMSGIATSGAHQIKRVLETGKQALALTSKYNGMKGKV